MTRVVFIIVQAISWFTTGIAVYPLLAAQAAVYFGAGTLAAATGAALAVAVTTVIQACLTLGWTHFHKAPLARPFTLLFALAMSAASGLLAGASWTAFTESTLVEQRIHDRATARATEPLWAFSQTQAGIAADAEMLSLLAGEKKTLEQAEGGSCDGDRKEASCGVKCRLRQRQAGLFAELAGDARSLAEQATRIATRFSREATTEQLREAFVEARRLAGGSERAAIATRLQSQLRGFNDGWRDPDTGTTFLCRDSAMTSAIDSLLGRVEAPVIFPGIPPTRVELQFLDTLEIATARVFRLLLRLVAGDDAQPPAEAAADSAAAGSDDDVIYGLGIGLAVELIIIWLIGLDMGIRRARGTIEDELGSYLDARRPLDENSKAEVRDILSTLHEMTFAANGREYFAVPVDGDPAAAARYADIATRLRLHPCRHAGDGVDLAAIEPHWVAARAHLHGSATIFRLYPINRRARAWRTRAARDLAGAGLRTQTATP